MPKLLFARAAQDEKEEHQIRKLAGSRHAPGDWILRAKMTVGSWERERATTIAYELGCHPQTLREHTARFNEEGLDGLGDRPGVGRKPRLMEEERGRIVVLARAEPPGKPVRMGDELQAVEPEKEGRTPPQSQWSRPLSVCAGEAQGSPPAAHQRSPAPALRRSQSVAIHHVWRGR